MIPVYYINLLARPDRREHMERQFDRLGIAAERIEAVLPAQVPPDIVASARRPDGTFRLGLGDIACTLSHFAAWRRAIDSGAAACIVFEDDGVISSEFPGFLEKLGRALPAGVDVLKLETFRHGARLGRHAVVVGGTVAQRLIGTHYGACGYVISTKLAAQVMATMPVASRAIDGHLFARYGDVLATRRVYQTPRALAVQLMHQRVADKDQRGQSDIAPTRRTTPAARHKTPRWQRLGQNVALAWREYRAFGHEVLNPRAPIPFADDEPAPRA